MTVDIIYNYKEYKSLSSGLLVLNLLLAVLWKKHVCMPGSLLFRFFALFMNYLATIREDVRALT